MKLTADSMFVKNALKLFESNFYTDISQVPNLYNLREVVLEELNKITAR